MENSVFKTVSISDQEPLRIHAQVLDNSLKIVVLQKENAWQCFVKLAEFKNAAKQQKLSLKEYSDKLLEYIGSPTRDIEIRFDSEELTVDRKLNNDLKIKYFHKKLEKKNYYECVEDLLDCFNFGNNDLSKRLKELEVQKNELSKSKTNYEEKIEELVSKHKTEKDELFGKFVLILNEKKHRIQHLTELLEAFRSGSLPSNPPVSLKKRKTKAEESKKEESKRTKLEAVSDSASSSEDDMQIYNTDSEKSDSDEPKPSTSNIQLFQSVIDKDTTISFEDLPKKSSSTEKKNESRSSLVLKNNNQEEDIDPKIKEEDVKPEEKQESQMMDFNTQQLLDML